jgi:alkylation response protein AidB-like acyl-CoA dehydrogenase
LVSVKSQRSPDALFSVLVPLKAPGVTIVPDWDAMGMRGSGSNSVELKDVFVPEDCVIAHRHRPSAPLTKMTKSGQAARAPGLLIALPVVTAVYLGIARRTHVNAVRRIVGTARASEPQTVRLAGLMAQELHSAWWALNAAIRASNDSAIGTEPHFVTIMLAKRQAVLGALTVAQHAMDMVGGSSYFCALQFEQALRDIRAAPTHPLSPEASLFEVGQSVLDRAFDGPVA